MIIRNKDLTVTISQGPSTRSSDLASDEAKFIKVRITAKTEKGRKKLKKFIINSPRRFNWIDRTKNSLSIKCYADL